MKKDLLHIVILLGLLILIKLSFGQNSGAELMDVAIPAMALIDLEGTPASFDLEEDGAAGTMTLDKIAETTWINYTSIVDPGTTNKITVEITGGEVPPSASLSIYVHAANTGYGNGALGMPVDGAIEADGGELTDYVYRAIELAATDVIVGIGSAYTGVGVGKGHLIRYKWSVNPNEFQAFKTSTGTVNITYTITSE